MNIVRVLTICAAVCASSAIATGAAAATTIPFQINAAPLGNPNGSFDVKAPNCVAVTGERPGTVQVTGGGAGRWGCSPGGLVQWINLATGATGTVRLSPGLHGYVPEAVLYTGPGQVALTFQAGGINTPGLATFFVP